MNKFKIGDKVKIPTAKPLSCDSLLKCSLIQDLPAGQDFAYITGLDSLDSDDVVLGPTLKDKCSRFRVGDIELYSDEPNYEIY